MGISPIKWRQCPDKTIAVDRGAKPQIKQDSLIGMLMLFLFCLQKGNTALHIASLAGHEDIVKLLVEHEAKINVQAQVIFHYENIAIQYILNKKRNATIGHRGFLSLKVKR